MKATVFDLSEALGYPATTTSHYHCACNHPYQGSIFTLLDFSDTCNIRAGDRQIIQNPRWCEKCVENRGRALVVLYEGRLRLHSSPSNEADRERGLRDGRIAALKVPFESIARLRQIKENVGQVNELFDLFGKVEIAPRERNAVEREEELSEMFKNIGLEAIDRGMGKFRALEDYLNGLMDGIQMQGSLEGRACEESDGKKKSDLLELALA